MPHHLCPHQPPNNSSLSSFITAATSSINLFVSVFVENEKSAEKIKMLKNCILDHSIA
jgi:hypothetical protein